MHDNVTLAQNLVDALNAEIDDVEDHYTYVEIEEQDKTDLIHNLSGDLNKVNNEAIKIKMVSYFYLADENYGMRLAKATHVPLEKIMKKSK